MQEASRLTFPNGNGPHNQSSEIEGETNNRFSSSDRHFSQANGDAAFS